MLYIKSIKYKCRDSREPYIAIHLCGKHAVKDKFIKCLQVEPMSYSLSPGKNTAILYYPDNLDEIRIVLIDISNYIKEINFKLLEALL